MQTLQEKRTTSLKKSKLMGPCANEFMSSNTGSWRIERPVVRQEDCIKCGSCRMYCPADLITIDKEGEVCVTIDLNYCKGCGICANECPKQCIDMVEERSLK